MYDVTTNNPKKIQNEHVITINKNSDIYRSLQNKKTFIGFTKNLTPLFFEIFMTVQWFLNIY